MTQRIDQVGLDDGTQVAFATAGRGPALVYLPGWVSHLELGWALPAERRFYAALAEGRTLVRYDRPGSGLSGPAPDADLVAVEMQTLRAVTRAAGVDRFDVLGTSLSAPLAVKWAAAHPETVSRLVLYGGWVEGERLAPPTFREHVLGLVEHHWGVGSEVLTESSCRAPTRASGRRSPPISASRHRPRPRGRSSLPATRWTSRRPSERRGADLGHPPRGRSCRAGRRGTPARSRDRGGDADAAGRTPAHPVRRGTAALERSTDVLVADALLALVLWQWRPIGGSLWHVHARPWRDTLWAVCGLGWLLAIASMFMVDHFDLVGLRQATSRPGSYRPPEFKERWAYAVVRHPLMLGLLIAFWVTPDMTAGHLLFAVVSTCYVAVGVHLEERDLRRDLGAPYLEYAARTSAVIPRPRRAEG